MRRPSGLRTQLLVGLTVIILMASISVGVITVWSTRQQMAEMEQDNGRLLGHALSLQLAATLQDRKTGESSRRRMLASMAMSRTVQSIEVVDARMNILARSQEGPIAEESAADLAAAINTGQQVVSVPEGKGQLLVVSTPIFVEGKVAGGVRVQTLLGPDRLGWPRLFWSLMLADGLVMVLFVTLVLTRYVIRPVEAMQRAAIRVTRGDLDVRLAEEGARELASLAASFNSMTASVQEQLERLDRQRRELAASRMHLVASEKLASVGRLAAGVAHEVGNPMQSIVGFTEILLQGGADPSQERDMLLRIRDETQRIHKIIRELLDYARPVQEGIEAVDLSAVVEQSLQLVGPQRRLREVEVVRRGLDSLPRVAARGQRMNQVLVNLLLNAADAMQGRGTIFIEGRQAGEDHVELRVSNTGPPIPTADRDRIFDPFFSTKEPGAGTGLGLSVALTIMESFDGRLYLEEGEPTTFVMMLPRWRS